MQEKLLETLKKKIEHLIYNSAPDFKIAKLIKEDLKEYYATLPQSFAQSGGKDFLLKHTRKFDTIIKLVYRIATREMFGQYFPSKNATPLTIAALGSYGREQLSPKSDIDILFVYKDLPAYNTKELIEKIYYLLLDAGLKLGHRVHEIDELEEVAKSDITIKSALLESRFVDGSKYLWFEIENKLNHIREFGQKEFILEKIKERRSMRAKYPLTMEPNLKEGVGGFRDANLVYWIGKVLFNAPRIQDLPNEIVQGKDYAAFRVALEFLFRVRAALHLSVKRKTDHLRLEHIPQVATYLGYKNTSAAHMVFAKKVNKSLRTLWLYSRIWIEALTTPFVPLYKNYLQAKVPFRNSSEALEFLITNAKAPYRSHPKLNQYLLHTQKSQDATRGAEQIIAIFKAPYTSSILTALSEVNQLGLYITPMKKVEALPQFDGYHRFPVDTHSIECIRALENITDIYIQKLYASLSPKEELLLKLATFLHDAGKGRASDHHMVGAKLFKAYAAKLQLDKKESALGVKLVTYHNKLSETAQKEDIYDPKVIARFVGIFPTELELTMILLLTYADTTGVGNNIYNEFTARLFKTLYENALEFVNQSGFLEELQERAKRTRALKNSANFKKLPTLLQRKIVNIESNIPFIRYRTPRIIKIAQEAIKTESFLCQITNEKFLTIEIIKKSRIDLGYLLSKLSYLNLAQMDIIKLFDEKKYFKIDFNQRVESDTIGEIEQIVEDSFLKQKQIAIKKPFIKRENITFDCNRDKLYAQMRLSAKDQKGLLAFVMNIFEELNVEIVSSKIYTHKNSVDDLFIIEKNENFCKNLEHIVKALGS